MLWLRGHGIDGEVPWHKDWTSNPDKPHRLQAKHCAPVGARLARIPFGRKQHNGRVERSHRTDDEEFYLSFLGTVRPEEGVLEQGGGMGVLLQPRAAALR